MKFFTLAATAIACAFPTFAQTAMQSVTCNPQYDNGSLSLSEVACSNGINGLKSKGYTTLGSLPDFPYVGGAYTVAGFNSPACGTCYTLTLETTGKTVYVLIVDAADGFAISVEAMNALTGGLGCDLGRTTVVVTQVDASYCGL